MSSRAFCSPVTVLLLRHKVRQALILLRLGGWQNVDGGQEPEIALKTAQHLCMAVRLALEPSRLQILFFRDCAVQ